LDFEVTDLADRLADFSTTAGVITQLDLVVTVDTAVCHLAGALGKPVWTLLAADPDWRWKRDGSHTPWYPTMRLFRQRKLGDWTDVIAEVAAALSSELL
jgi:ADP-heptose:LPS heptosyltransferase